MLLGLSVYEICLINIIKVGILQSFLCILGKYKNKSKENQYLDVEDLGFK